MIVPDQDPGQGRSPGSAVKGAGEVWRGPGERDSSEEC